MRKRHISLIRTTALDVVWEQATGWGTVVFAGLTVMFVLSQSLYFANNVLVDLLLYNRTPEVVDEDSEPGHTPTVHVLTPLYEESRAVVRQTLEGIDRLEYPSAELAVYLITEPDDERVDGYLEELLAEFEDRELTIERTTVNRRTVQTYLEEGTWDPTSDGVPRTKATALKYAFRTLTLPPNDVVTVFDADTVVPEDTFSLAVAGLEEYDVVQAKQTVRNHRDGWLPRLEAMGIAGWCNAIYTKTTRGPYQLLGKAYFIRVADLWAVDDWQVDAITEDLTLGIEAYTKGYSLGVIDRYIQDICPAGFDDWVSQKRRWVAGPYSYLRYDDFAPAELLRFWVYSASNQVISVVNVVGVPVGILYFLLVVAGFDLYNSLLLVVITAVNLVNWAYYSLKTYQATRDGVEFASRREALAFYLTANPLSQLVYSMIWAVPIALAVRDYLRPPENVEFRVTPKRVETIQADTEREKV